MEMKDYEKLRDKVDLVQAKLVTEAECIVQALEVIYKPLLKGSYLGTSVQRFKNLLAEKERLYREIHDLLMTEADAASFKEAPNG